MANQLILQEIRQKIQEILDIPGDYDNTWYTTKIIDNLNGVDIYHFQFSIKSSYLKKFKQFANFAFWSRPIKNQPGYYIRIENLVSNGERI